MLWNLSVRCYFQEPIVTSDQNTQASNIYQNYFQTIIVISSANSCNSCSEPEMSSESLTWKTVSESTAVGTKCTRAGSSGSTSIFSTSPFQETIAIICFYISDRCKFERKIGGRNQYHLDGFNRDPIHVLIYFP